MKKRVFGRKFSRDRGSRTALFKSLSREFILHGEITTTQARAKALKPLIDRLVTLSKKQSVASRRSLAGFLHDHRLVVQKLDQEVKARFEGLSSGFTKYVRLMPRLGDAAPRMKISWSRDRKEQEKKVN